MSKKSKKSGTQVDHIFRKYPELLNAFDVIDNGGRHQVVEDDANTKRDMVGLGRILRRRVARGRKTAATPETVARKYEAENSRQPKRFLNNRTSLSLHEKDSSDTITTTTTVKGGGGDVAGKKLLFTCPICRDVLETPVTVLCGHTFCRGCLDRVGRGKCFECETDVGVFGGTNILVQDIIDKWKEVRQVENVLPSVTDRRSRGGGKLCRTTTERSSRYCLRSRCNGLHGNTPIVNDLNHVVNINKNHQRGLTSASWAERPRRSQVTTATTWSNITSTDLECILCSQCLLSPVTTTCGHTFCRECLARVLDHRLACPLCMAPLKTVEQYRGETTVLNQALSLLAPDEHEERLHVSQQVIENLESSNQVPIFICTNAFPKVACPLFVYEPRYRLLARRCLQSTGKRFGMAAKTTTGDKFALCGTLLEIRDCISFPDGTSILTTIGLRRFKVLSRGEQDGYDTAMVQYIQDSTVPVDKLPALIALHERVYNKTKRWLEMLKLLLLAEIERCIGCLPPLEKDWPSLPDGPTWTWWLVAILPMSVHLRSGFLASTSLGKRLLAVEKMLDYMKLKMNAVERNALNCTDREEGTESCTTTSTTNERSVDMPYQVNE